MQEDEFPKEHDDDNNELENNFYRRLYYVLSKHELDIDAPLKHPESRVLSKNK